MPQDEGSRRGVLWRLVGLAVGGALALSLLYALITPSETGLAASGALRRKLQGWSDALCVSAMLLGLGSGIPFLLDAGRGLMLPNKMGTSRESRERSWDEERAKREKGIKITFALGLAALLTGVFSLLISLW